MLGIKELYALIGALLDLASSLPYIYGITRRGIRPHFFSWLVWVVVMSVGFSAQIVEGAGIGSLVLGTALATTCVITVMAFLKGERRGTRSDWICLLTAMSAIPLWLAVDDPLPSVLLITAIDLIAYGPTFRKAWIYPREELLLMWSLGSAKFVFAVFALEQYSLSTWLYPTAIATANALLCVLLLYRRQQVEWRREGDTTR